MSEIDGAVRIPLRARDGSVRAYVIVDAADADWANQWRWSLSGKGYAARGIGKGSGGSRKQHSVKLHRDLLGLKLGDRRHGDHIDRDKLNCRRSNLRIVPPAGNAQNLTKRGGTSSRYRGVWWSRSKQRWEAQVRVRGRIAFYGTFATEEEAGAAASSARSALMPYAVETIELTKKAAVPS